MDKRDELRLGFETAYIDGSVASNSFYSPQFVSNNYKDGKKVLSSIEDELLRCDKFQISVAFITLGGITPLLQTLKELEKKNIPGEILTGLSQDLLTYGKSISKEQQENIINVMTNEFPAGSGKKTYSQCVFIEKEGNDYKPTKTFLEMLSDRDFYNVKYADDAHAIFGKIADIVYPKAEELLPEDDITESIDEVSKPELEIEETYCWTIWNKNRETEMYSGFNSFFGIGSKMGKDQRKQRIEKLYTEYEDQVEYNILYEIKQGMTEFLLEPASSVDEKAQKVRLREYLVRLAKQSGTFELKKDIFKLLYRPMDEMYIPIPDSAQFHKDHPNFFGKGYGKTKPGTNKLELPKEARRFNLIFEPSGDVLPAYITQDNGKAIESAEKQTYLGEWILRGVFQLEEYEPLTSARLAELNINGLRFTKYKGSEDIHIEFIWIDEENPPKGFIPRK